ncbi:MAG TPA: site-specific integrase [Sedimentisphaerales bacterium]|jgi:site-specific recombinase XerD|nr:site-specific integrase [Sedimentisphaerales bacterium]HNU28859.1 site-specific integrase [Sedimentisphaerales bacterium]
MHKAWLYKRKNRDGYHVMWYGSDGRLRSKQAPTKGVAERFKQRLKREMNSDLFTDAQSIGWDEVVAEYLKHIRLVRRAGANTIESYDDVLSNFRRLVGPIPSIQVPDAVTRYVAARTEDGVSAATVNKDLRTLQTFIHWAVEAQYMNATVIKWRALRQKTVTKAKRAITVPELAALIQAATDLYRVTWRIRILLAVSTGMRRRDIERLSLADIDLQAGNLHGVNQKAHKESFHPLHRDVIPELRAYMAELPRSQTRLFADKWHDTKWGRIKCRAAIQGLRYHDLRVSCASFILQAGFSTSVAQNILEHGTPNLTHDIYTDVTPVYRNAVNAIPLGKALSTQSGESSSAPANHEYPSANSESRRP